MAQIALFLFFTMSFCLLMIGLKENMFRNMHVVGSTCSTHGESTRIENLVLCYSLDSPRTPRPLSMATIACSVSPVRYCFYGSDRLVPIFHYEFLWHACCWLNLLLYACSTYGESTRIKKSGIVLQARFSTHAAGGLNHMHAADSMHAS